MKNNIDYRYLSPEIKYDLEDLCRLAIEIDEQLNALCIKEKIVIEATNPFAQASAIDLESNISIPLTPKLMRDHCYQFLLGYMTVISNLKKII